MAANLSNLSRATIIRNPNYQRNGLKSYVHALKKCKLRSSHATCCTLSTLTSTTVNIGPTVEGPYTMAGQMHQTGQQAIFKKLGKKVGGKAHVKGHTLVKKDPTTGQTGEVPVRLHLPSSVYHGPTLTPPRLKTLSPTRNTSPLSALALQLRTSTLTSTQAQPICGSGVPSFLRQPRSRARLGPRSIPSSTPRRARLGRKCLRTLGRSSTVTAARRRATSARTTWPLAA